MEQCTVRANAKINWSLDVTGVREDGYHLLDMVLSSVELHDTVRLRRSDAWGIYTDCSTLACDERNIALRAARLFAAQQGIDTPVTIEIEKRIPLQAGLGGGSADAAAVLRGMARLFDVPVTEQALAEMGLALGADVPFMLRGGLARVRGIGEELTFYPCERRRELVILKPAQGASTAEIFRAFDGAYERAHPDNAHLINALQTGAASDCRRDMINALQPVAAEKVPEIARALDLLRSCGAAAMMTGSGSAVFGVFDTPAAAKEAYTFCAPQMQAFLTRTCGSGIVCEGEKEAWM